MRPGGLGRVVRIGPEPAIEVIVARQPGDIGGVDLHVPLGGIGGQGLLRLRAWHSGWPCAGPWSDRRSASRRCRRRIWFPRPGRRRGGQRCPPPGSRRSAAPRYPGERAGGCWCASVSTGEAGGGQFGGGDAVEAVLAHPDPPAGLGRCPGGGSGLRHPERGCGLNRRSTGLSPGAGGGVVEQRLESWLS